MECALCSSRQGIAAYGPCVETPKEPHAMCALAKGNLLPSASSRLEAESPNHAGRYDGRGEDRGSPAELLRATRLSRLARPLSDQRYFVALLYTLSRDTTQKTIGAVRSGTFLLWHPYGDTTLSCNKIEHMTSYHSYSVTGPISVLGGWPTVSARDSLASAPSETLSRTPLALLCSHICYKLKVDKLY
jgi:hypothetical protein